MMGIPTEEMVAVVVVVVDTGVKEKEMVAGILEIKEMPVALEGEAVVILVTGEVEMADTAEMPGATVIAISTMVRTIIGLHVVLQHPTHTHGTVRQMDMIARESALQDVAMAVETTIRLDLECVPPMKNQVTVDHVVVMEAGPILDMKATMVRHLPAGLRIPGATDLQERKGARMRMYVTGLCNFGYGQVNWPMSVYAFLDACCIMTVMGVECSFVCELSNIFYVATVEPLKA